MLREVGEKLCWQQMKRLRQGSEGDMRTRTCFLLLLLTTGMTLTPVVRAQTNEKTANPEPPPLFSWELRKQAENAQTASGKIGKPGDSNCTSPTSPVVASPDSAFPLPLFHDRPESGGMYFGSFITWKPSPTSQPTQSQLPPNPPREAGIPGDIQMPQAIFPEPSPGATREMPAGSTALPIFRGQDYSPPDPQFPVPLFSNRPELGGLYAGMEFLFFRTTNPLRNQVIAVRGFVDSDGSISPLFGEEPVPGNFFGSGAPALSTGDMGGANYTPGYYAALGWLFRSGFALELNWKHLFEAKYSATASITPFLFRYDPQLADSFLFSPVFNFPPEFAGAANNLPIGNLNATYGIWNAATVMQEFFTQRFDQWEMKGRVPIYLGEDCRYYGLVGPRLVSIWERFKWRTVDADFNYNYNSDTIAVYSNTLSNRLYGGFAGCGIERRLGDTPAGTFAVTLETDAALLVNVFKGRAKYERDDRYISSHHTRRYYTIVPELQADFTLWWYPIEGVQIRFGYDVMAFFNTLSSPSPVSFNFGTLDATYERQLRFYDGFHGGIAFIF